MRRAAIEKPSQWPPAMPSFWLSIHSCAAGVSAQSSPVAAEADLVAEQALHLGRAHVLGPHVVAVVLEGEAVVLGAEAAVGDDLALGHVVLGCSETLPALSPFSMRLLSTVKSSFAPIGAL